MQNVFINCKKEGKGMAEMAFQQGVTCIVMDEKDNVTTLLADMKKRRKRDLYKGKSNVRINFARRC